MFFHYFSLYQVIPELSGGKKIQIECETNAQNQTRRNFLIADGKIVVTERNLKERLSGMEEEGPVVMFEGCDGGVE